MINDLIPANPDKKDAYSRILRFYTDDDITLLAHEEVIHSRWLHADALIRQRRFSTDDIVDKLKDKFSISKFTALNDIAQCYALFEKVRKISKKYLLVLHAEKIALQIQTYSQDKSLVHLIPKLNDNYTKALAAIPDEVMKSVLPPPVFIFNAAPGQHIDKPMDIGKAREAALRKMQEKKDVEDIDHEDVTNDAD